MWTLCSKDDIQSVYRIPQDQLEDSWSSFTEKLIRDYLREPNLGTQLVIVDERYSGDGTRLLKVKNPPIISVESLVVDSSFTIPSSDIVVGRSTVELIDYHFPLGRYNVKLSYTSGSPYVSTLMVQSVLALVEGTTVSVNYPIESVDSVSVNGTPLLSTDYTFSGSSVVLVVGTFPARATVVVTYTARYVQIDDNVKFCAATMIAAMHKFKARQGGEKSFKWDESDKRVGDTEQDYLKLGLTSYLQAIMKRTLIRGSLRAH